MSKTKFGIVKQIIEHKNKKHIDCYPYYQEKWQPYVETDRTIGKRVFNKTAKDIIDRFQNFEILINKLGSIKGVTKSSNTFELVYNKEKKPYIPNNALWRSIHPSNFKLKIYNSDTEYYQEFVSLAHIYHYGVISYVNKVQNDLNKEISNTSMGYTPKYKSKNEQIITVSGEIENKEYTIRCGIQETNLYNKNQQLPTYAYNYHYRPTLASEFKFVDNDEVKTNVLSCVIPEHIPEKQRFKYLSLSVANHDTVLEMVKRYYISDSIICCNEKIKKEFTFCPFCGGKPEIPEITVTNTVKDSKYTVISKG